MRSACRRRGCARSCWPAASSPRRPRLRAAVVQRRRSAIRSIPAAGPRIAGRPSWSRPSRRVVLGATLAGLVGFPGRHRPAAAEPPGLRRAWLRARQPGPLLPRRRRSRGGCGAAGGDARRARPAVDPRGRMRPRRAPAACPSRCSACRQEMTQQRKLGPDAPSALWPDGSAAPAAAGRHGGARRPGARRAAPTPRGDAGAAGARPGTLRDLLRALPRPGRRRRRHDPAAAASRTRRATTPPGCAPRRRQYYFDVITKGYGVMYGYAARVAPADRWAIIAYIRALQLSRRCRARRGAGCAGRAAMTEPAARACAARLVARQAWPARRCWRCGASARPASRWPAGWSASSSGSASRSAPMRCWRCMR